jgi:uncharacterized protein YeaO (DUF488 family)
MDSIPGKNIMSLWETLQINNTELAAETIRLAVKKVEGSKVLYTTHYKNIKKIPEEAELVVVSRMIPEMKTKGRSWAHAEFLAPSYPLLNQFKFRAIDWDTFKDRFTEELKGRENILNLYLEAMKAGEDFCFICWEKDHAECHRSILGQWFEEKGIQWKEL